MPKQITVEVTAMAYDQEAAQDSRTLQPLTIENEHTVTADTDAQAIVEALAFSVNQAAARFGQPEVVMLPEPVERVVDEMRDAMASFHRASVNTLHVHVSTLRRWADMLVDAYQPGEDCDSACETGATNASTCCRKAFGGTD